MIDKFNSYIKLCIDDLLIDNKKYSLPKYPKISVSIPIFNGGKYLHYSLRSVQNQKMKEIEILLVDDCSTDDTMKIIEKYIKEDERIRLIKNFENRKILYSKSIAALNARGKYIIQLDQDDIFIRDDIFDILFYEAEKYNLDLVQIRDIIKQNFIFTNLTRVNYKNLHLIFPQSTHYKIQPELQNTMFGNNNNYLLWGMLINTDIYKKAIYNLWPIIINYKIKFQEDYIITFMIAIFAQRYKYLNNFALIHLIHSNATSSNFVSNDEFFLGVLFAGNIIYDYSIKKNPKNIIIIIDYMLRFEYYINIGKKIFPKLFLYLIKKIINNKYLSINYKEKIKNNFNITNDNILKNIFNFHIYKNGDNKFINKYQNLIINKKDNIFYNKPKISIIIFVSEYKSFLITFNSILKQNFIYFEIIVIYDREDKMNLYLIKAIIKKYNNIKLIDNGKSKGFIFSISTGVLYSKGKYIIILKTNSFLPKYDTLNELYNIIISDKSIDILEFNLLIDDDYKENNSLSIYKCPHFKSEFNLTNIKYYNNYIEIDISKDLLNNKIIKAKSFKDCLKKYNFKNIKRRIFNYYDNIFLFALQNRNNSVFRRINYFGIIEKNILNKKDIINDLNQKIKDAVFYINFLFENSNDTFQGKEIALYEYFNLMSLIYNRFNKITKESYYLFEKFINCKYITSYNKYLLHLYYNSLIN